MWSNVSDCCIKIVHQFIRRKSVLYVCERVNTNNNGHSIMAAAREKSTSRYPTVKPNQQHDITLGYPIQVSLPDGETFNHHYNPIRRHNGGPEQEAELTRGYIKPPENKSISDLEALASHGESFMTFHRNAETGRHKKNIQKQCRHAPSLEVFKQHVGISIGHHRFGTASSLSSSSSSITSGWSSSATEEETCSPGRGRKVQFQKQLLPTLLPNSKGEKHDGGRKASRSSSTFNSRTISESFPPSLGSVGHPEALLPYPSTTTTLADIAVVTCGTASSSGPHSSGAHSFRTGYNNVQVTYSSSSDLLDRYSDVLESPSLYRNVCQSTKERTDNDHI